MSQRFKNMLAVIGPGILVAATGVGAGDLGTASFTGIELGLTILWAVLLGAFLKYVLTEGLARWQLATGDTLLEGCVEHLGRPVLWFFLVYLVAWSFLVGTALISAVGVVSHAIFPLFAGLDETAARNDKIVYGILHSLLAIGLVKFGGYRLFSRVMSVCIAIMFAVVIVTAVALKPPIGEVMAGMLVPTIPKVDGAVGWTVGLLGGVGGTVTVLGYGYWIREENRQGIEQLKNCRIDLLVAYVMTAIFGLAMVVIGSSLKEVSGKGANLVVAIANNLNQTLGPMAKWAFLIGAYGAVFSSVLGVWQSIPYLFADLCGLMKRGSTPERTYRVDIKALPYQAYLWGIGLVPILGLVFFNFKSILKIYAVVGAFFIPMLAVVLLILNGREKWVGARQKNKIWTTMILVAMLVFFVYAGALGIYRKVLSQPGGPPREKSAATSRYW